MVIKMYNDYKLPFTKSLILKHLDKTYKREYQNSLLYKKLNKHSERLKCIGKLELLEALFIEMENYK